MARVYSEFLLAGSVRLFRAVHATIWLPPLMPCRWRCGRASKTSLQAKYRRQK